MRLKRGIIETSVNFFVSILEYILLIWLFSYFQIMMRLFKFQDFALFAFNLCIISNLLFCIFKFQKFT